MEITPMGESIMVVVHLRADAAGIWQIQLEGLQPPATLPLRPGTLLIRLWRDGNTGVLRGSVGLHGGTHSAPLQSNGQLIELIRAWLLDGDESGKQTFSETSDAD